MAGTHGDSGSDKEREHRLCSAEMAKHRMLAAGFAERVERLERELAEGGRPTQVDEPAPAAFVPPEDAEGVGHV